MTITAIEPQKRKKDRYNIYADGEYVASLGAEAIVRIGLKTGTAIGQDELDSAVLADNVQFAFDSAVRLLTHGMRTRSELERRLREKGIAAKAIEPAIEKLASYGYVDDAAYAKEFVQSAIRTGRWGKLAVAQRLKEKGLTRSVIDAALAGYTDEDEKRIARRQLESRPVSIGDDAHKQRQKAFAALSRHGFSYDMITALLSEADD